MTPEDSSQLPRVGREFRCFRSRPPPITPGTWRNYNPQQSFDRALNLLYDERARQGLRVWARVYDDGVFKPLFQRRAGAVDLELMGRRLAELQGATEMIGVTLNQGLLRENWPCSSKE